MHINDLLKIAVERKASDLHLKVGAHPIIRVDGDLIPLVDMKRLMQEDTIAMAFSIAGLRAEGVTLDDPACVKKTFPTFHDVLADTVARLRG